MNYTQNVDRVKMMEHWEEKFYVKSNICCTISGPVHKGMNPVAKAISDHDPLLTYMYVNPIYVV